MLPWQRGDLVALNDSLSFGIKTYSCEYTISANDSATITASQFGAISIPGYSPVAIIRATTGRAEVALTAFIGRQSGSSTMMSLRNTTNVAISTTATIQILYTKAPVTNFDA